MKTTQENFHVMRGHVADGCVIACGKCTLTIRATMTGWQVSDDTGGVVAQTNSAYAVQDAVLAYDGDAPCKQ